MSDDQQIVASSSTRNDLNHIIAISSGFVDVFKIRCHGQPTIVLPQNLILSVQTHSTAEKNLIWQGKELPIYVAHQPDKQEAIALITGNIQLEQYFVILCDDMPEALRLRISEVTDVHGLDEKKNVFQYIRVNKELCQIPVLEEMYADLLK